MEIETGWLLPDGEYIQTVGNKKAPSDDAIEVALRPEEYYDYEDGEWVVNFDRETDFLGTRVRVERAERLIFVDELAGSALRWGELTADQQAAWSQYRRDLLDITDQVGFPRNVTWPTKPE